MSAALGKGAAAVSAAARAVVDDVIKPVAVVALPAAKGAGYGLGSAPLLGLFLLVQRRIDRRDPKLALAPAYADADLTFNEIPRGPMRGRAASP